MIFFSALNMSESQSNKNTQQYQCSAGSTATSSTHRFTESVALSNTKTPVKDPEIKPILTTTVTTPIIHTLPNLPKWVSLNVGGKIFSTTLSTLSKEPSSMLARMFCQDQMNPSEKDHTGAYLIDRSSQYFEPIINYLRHGQLIRDEGISLYGILEEAKFFGIEGLIPHLEHLITVTAPMEDVPLTRRDVINAIIQTSHTSELRFQGVNFTGADLSKLDLRHVNFKVSFFLCIFVSLMTY